MWYQQFSGSEKHNKISLQIFKPGSNVQRERETHNQTGEVKQALVDQYSKQKTKLKTCAHVLGKATGKRQCSET